MTERIDIMTQTEASIVDRIERGKCIVVIL